MMNSKNQKAEDGKNAGSAKKSVQTGKKRISKEEAMKRLDSLNLTQAQKRYYFSFMSKAENPY